MLELQHAARAYTNGRRTVNALHGVSLKIETGEFVAIMGPSGSGKSTLLRLLGALDAPDSGRVLILGRDVRSMSDRQRSLLRRDRLGFVFQSFNLLPTLTAIENVALPRLLAGVSRTTAHRDASVALERVGLVPRAGHFPDELSGGEMQRVAVARALVGNPDVVLCDEPTGNLDSATGDDVLALLRSLPEAGRRTVVLVTHDRAAARVADRIIQIRDGQIEADDFLRGAHALAA